MNQVYSFFTVLLAFVFWNFTVYISIIPIEIQKVVYWCLPVIYIIVNRKDFFLMFKQINNKYLFYSFGFFIIAIVWGKIVIVINGSSDFSYDYIFLSVVKEMIVNIFLCMIIRARYEHNIMEKYSIFYVLSLTLCVISTVIFISYPEFKFIWNNILAEQGVHKDELIEYASYITRYSFMGFTGFDITIKSSIVVLLSIYLLDIKSKYGYIGIIIGCIANMFYGRIGILLSLMIIIYTLISKMSIKYFIYIFTLLMSIVVIINLLDNPILDIWISWMIEPVVSFFNGLAIGQITFGSSGDKLAEGMYFMPNIDTMLWGDGKHINLDGTYYMHTDAGIMRIILYMGIPGLLLVYSAFMLILLAAYKILRRSSSPLRNYLIPLAIIFIISEYKGEIYPLFFGIISAFILSSNSVKE